MLYKLASFLHPVNKFTLNCVDNNLSGCCVCGCDLSIIRHTLLGEQSSDFFSDCIGMILLKIHSPHY